ncbi:MAG: Demethylmenaquinone methyltransferase [Verrucomicrobiota bacterium]
MWYFRSLHSHFRRELQRAKLPAAAAVLDAGCGTGGLISRLRAAEPDWRFTGVDFMPLACDLARTRCGPDVPILQGSIEALPFADQSFEAVVSGDVLCQIDHGETALAEFRRVLRPGGIAVINVPAYPWLWSYHDESVGTKHRFTRPEMARLLTAAGFRVVTLTHWNALPFPLVWAKRKLVGSNHTSDVKLYPAPVEWALNRIMSLEHAWLRWGGRWAWGSSVFAVAYKP